MISLLLALGLGFGQETVPRAGAPFGEVLAAYAKQGAEPLWPRWDPRGTPCLVFDGERTWYVGSRRPVGFEPPHAELGFARPESLAEAQRVLCFPGRHPQVRSNTSIDFDGVRTATYRVPAGAGARAIAAGMLHEAFHVFQDARHPSWSADELDQLAYPATDVDVLYLRVTETEALDRALERGRDERTSAAWASAALDARGRRFELLGESLATYARALELREGLAQYVEHRSLGPDHVHAALGPYTAAGVRERVYDVGEAWARLLDRHGPGWREVIEGGGADSLDGYLATVLGDVQPAVFGEDERERLRRRALDIGGEHAQRLGELKGTFEDRPGWALEIVASDTPFWPAGFDPLNLHSLGEDQVLHTRMLDLQGEAGTVSLLDVHAVTTGAGGRPLQRGIAHVLVRGLASEPEVERVEGEDGVTRVLMRAPGLEAVFLDVRVERADSLLRVVSGE